MRSLYPAIQKKIAAIICLFAIILCISPLCSSIIAADTQGNDTVIMQAFHWESHLMKPWWNKIETKAADLKASNIDMLWLPPSSIACSDEGYLPSRLYHQNSQYGTSAQLKKCISILHSKGIKVLADIVINHRVGSTDWADFTEPKWGPESVCKDDEWAWAKGNSDTGTGYSAARDIDHSNKDVQKSLIQWLAWMKKEMGYDGWRFDYAKGFHGRYIEKYIRATKPCFAVGELWDYLNMDDPNAHRQQLCDWIDDTKGTCSTFDFTTKGVLQKAVAQKEYWRLKDSEDKPAGLIGWWPSKSVTFVDNHDTGPSTGGENGQNHWPFPSDEIMQGYCYILTHPGIPCIYWVHFYDWGFKTEIKKLIAIRKKFKITSTSKVLIAAAHKNLYAAYIDSKIAMKIGSGSWSPGHSWKLLASGKNYAVWSK